MSITLKISTENNKKSTMEVEAQSTIENTVCTECFFDREETDEDNKRFNDEMKDIDKKIIYTVVNSIE